MHACHGKSGIDRQQRHEGLLRMFTTYMHASLYRTDVVFKLHTRTVHGRCTSRAHHVHIARVHQNSPICYTVSATASREGSIGRIARIFVRRRKTRSSRPSLHTLDCSGCYHIKTLSPLSSLSSLHTLDCSGCYYIANLACAVPQTLV